jgi:hypothetical protein
MASTTFSGPVTSTNGFLGPVLATEQGTGISTATGGAYTSTVNRTGNIIHTQIFIDITGLSGSTDAAGDIIGVTGAANCHLGQITLAENGLLFAGSITCVETPGTGEKDIDIYSVDEDSGTEDVAIGTLTAGVALKVSAADWAALGSFAFTGVPVADQYIYLPTGDTAGGTYTAGQFMIELYGYVA